MNGAALSVLTLLSAGFVLGLKHALDADHVAVVSTLVSQTKSLKRSSLLGALWGLGHTATLLLVGLAVLLFKLAIPPRLALAVEFFVGIVVVLFGVDLLRKIASGKIHAHRHVHDGTAHSHLHAHVDGVPAHQHSHRAFAVGALHGLAGSAALTLFVLASVRSTLQGLAFILVFGLGSIVSMLLVSSAIGLPLLMTTRFAKVQTAIQTLAGATSIVIGLIIIYQIGFVRGLLT